MKKAPDYSNPKILKNYALWYYTSYYPSMWFLKGKLEEKSKDSELIKSIISEFKSNFNEDNLLETLIQNLLDKWKSHNFISQKLTLDKFEKKDIERILWNLENTWVSDSYLLQKILYSMKSKSLQKTKMNLIAGWFDKDLIEGIINSNDLKDSPELLETQYKELLQKDLPKEKIVEKMIGKGFLYKDVKGMVK
jgi:SOS response regulatory protein OraA/RecX